MKVLILGGYGVFGGRLAHLLADEPRFDLTIAGRDGRAAALFCERWTGRARVRPLALDRRDAAGALAALRPDVVVDASGPFQAYGGDPYVVPRAAVAAGASYLDLADGADFVAGIGALDEAARDAGVWVLSGVSSFPVLTHAVLAEMGRAMAVRRVAGGIAPSPYAGVGLNVLRAVLGYAGEPVALWRGGHEATAPGLGEVRQMTVAPPGALPLQPLRFSLVEVPDLRLIPEATPSIRDLWMGAAPQPWALHGLLVAMARLRARWGGPSLAPLAPLARLALRATEAGEHRGGMVVEAEGERDGRPVRRSWHMVAEADDGPLIPSMAGEAVLRKALDGEAPEPGARPALGALALEDYARLFARRRIVWGWRGDAPGSLYERVLGDAFATLPPQVRALHRPGARSVWRGRAEVQRGRGPLAALVCALFGFPREGSDVPVEVTFETDAEGRETWSRRFGGRLMRSVQEEGMGRDRHLMVERFGPLAFGLALVRDGGRLRIVPRQWSALGVPLPRRLMPGGDSWEEERDGRFRFHVEIVLPLVGRVVRYEGWLRPYQ